jgi:hypothetical protein
VDIAVNVTTGRRHFAQPREPRQPPALTGLIGSVSNRDAIGTKVRLVCDGIQQTRLSALQGYISASDKRVHRAGYAKTAESVELTWPSGTVQRLESVPVDQILTVREPSR